MPQRRSTIVLCLIAGLIAGAVAAPAASAALRSPRLASSCPSGSTYQEQTRGPLRLEGCLVTETDRWITAPGQTKAELSGFDVELLSGARIAVQRTGDVKVVSSGGNVRLRIKGGPIDIPVYEGTLSLKAPDSGVSFDFDLGQIPATARLLGLILKGETVTAPAKGQDDLGGKISYTMQATGTTLQATLQFPPVLSSAKFAVDFGVVDGSGLQLNSLEIGSGSAALPFDDVPGALLKDVQFKFTNPDNITIGGKLVLPTMVPQSFGVTLVFNANGLSSATGSVDGANLPILPPNTPFFLQGGSITVGANPLTFGGTVIISAGPVETATNSSILRHTGGFLFTNSSPSKFQLTGQTQLFTVGPLQGGSGTSTTTFTSDGVLDIDQRANLNLSASGVGGLTASSTIDGTFSKSGFRASGSGTGTLSAFGFTLASASATIKANGRGIGVCVTGSVAGFTVKAQARKDWDGSPRLKLGCNLDRFATRSLSRGTARAAASGTVSVPAGATNAVLQVRGNGAAPSFDLRLPNGTTVAVRDPKPEATIVNGVAFRADSANTTTVYVPSPPAGTWTVQEIAGQSLADVGVATDAPPAVRAVVTGDGESRTLTWDASDLGGGRLQISDVESDDTSTVLVDTDKPKGTTALRVPFGKAGPRKLVAVVTDAEGIARAEVPAGSYTADKPFVPAKPRDIKVSFSKKSGQLTFSQVQPSDPDRRPDYWYYKVALSDGRILYFQGSGTQKIKVRNVADNTDYTVSVFGIETEGLEGKARVEKGEA